MQSITFTNKNGDAMTFSRTFPNLLEKIQGVGSVYSEPLASRGFQQDGESYFGSLLEPRQIALSLWIKGETKDDLVEKRQAFIKTFNARLGLGTLVYTNHKGSWQIACAIDDSVFVTTGINNPLAQKCIISLYCPDPAWQSVQETAARLIGFEHGMTTPLTLPFSLGTQGGARTFNYTGTLNAPLRIEFRGPAVMPKIVKAETGETIEVEVDLAVDEKLIVDTSPNDIDVYTLSATGEKTSAFNYVKADSEYFMLTAGDNTLAFFAASGDPEAYVYWRERYVGV